MRLVLVRHAEAAPGEPDDLRELTPDGKQAARELGGRLAEQDLKPDVVLTSPLLRARQTGEELGRSLAAPVEPDERLAPGATAESVREAIAGRGAVVVVVCHQPDCGRVAAELSGGPEPRFPPAGLVELQLEG
ncbi:MAG: histidine phosphatase family protein [Gaiellaceae bacterium]